MEDKKQIEEMAKVIYESKVAIDGSDMAFGLFDEDDHFHRIARFLYKAGYRKLPEDSVVQIMIEHAKLIEQKKQKFKAEYKDKILLTKEELQELKKYKTDWLNSEKMHLQGELEYTEFELSCANEAYSTLCKLYDAAEEKLKKYIEFNNNLIVENQKLKDELIIARKETVKEFYNLSEEKGGGVAFYNAVRKLAKQYGIEKK